MPSYKQNNIVATNNLIKIVNSSNIKKFIFSSSCTVYGEPDYYPVNEYTPIKPAKSPYGLTKQICEEILQEVSKTGTGFLLIKRHVFEKLNAHPAVKPFNNDIGLPKELDPFMKTYFDTGVREGRYYSEDWAFCENWRDLGGDVWIDRRVLLKHTGTYVFDHAAQDRLYNDLRAIVVANGLDKQENNENVAFLI